MKSVVYMMFMIGFMIVGFIAFDLGSPIVFVVAALLMAASMVKAYFAWPGNEIERH